MKQRVAKRRNGKIGKAPGELIHIGDIKTAEPLVTLIEYNASEYCETRFKSLHQGKHHEPQHETLWLNVHGLQDIEILEEIGRRFKLHPLVLEDILNTDQRPKVEDYGDYTFIVARFFEYDPRTLQLNSDQISLVVGHNFVLSFQERPTGKFQALRERLQANKGLVRKFGADYLCYSLLDAIVDHYFVVLEHLSERTEQLESELLEKPQVKALASIHALKMDTMVIRRALWPLREVLNMLQHGEASLFRQETLVYLRDVYDHTVHVIESVEMIRDLISGMLDIYMSAMSHRLNQEMRVLTVITTIFMPLTLISSIYGMNFKHMPELDWYWGYYGVLGVMALIAAVMGVIFWRRKWI
mgnify:FL=1